MTDIPQFVRQPLSHRLKMVAGAHLIQPAETLAHANRVAADHKTRHDKMTQDQRLARSTTQGNA